MTFAAPALAPAMEAASLDNCDREPIHIPGHIQPHGCLLAFDDKPALIWRSDNAESLLGTPLPAPGSPLPAAWAEVSATVAQALEAGPAGAGLMFQRELRWAGAVFDLIAHHNGSCVIAEFEPRPADAIEPGAFSTMAHAAMGRLRHRRTIDELLQSAVTEIRALTGFDRVMAYRFRHDASGDIVAEARRDDLEPLLNRRYPAADIPAQARRLYVVNTLRLIADARATPAPVRGTSPQPLDMSWSSLRSVSPIHIEYLNNMGVAASMSVSIVVGGELWGMLACHHYAGPRIVPYAVRMACDVLGHMLASSVQTLLAAEHGRRMAQASSMRVALLEGVVVEGSLLAALKPSAEAVCASFNADALLATEGTETHAWGRPDVSLAPEIAAWLAAAHPGAGVVATSREDELPTALALALHPWCGVLAVRTDDPASHWLVLLRREQVETVKWGGRPEKNYVVGPNGPRLTPRGSFDEWRETVRGTSVPWGRTEIDMAHQLRGELLRAGAARHAEMAQARDQMLAILGHDLRNPLQTISMATHLLDRGGDAANIGQRIRRSSSRMERLISEVLDVSRLQSGLGLGVRPRDADLAALVREYMQDVRASHPGIELQLDVPAALHARADPDRVLQVLDNLVANARQHGQAGSPLRIAMRQVGDAVELIVANHAEPIPPDVVAQLFNPYKRQSVGNERNRGGMGLGLYIAREIAQGHGGTLEYSHAGAEVLFTLRLPHAAASA